MKKGIITLLTLLLSLLSSGQYAPANIGNITGSNGEPVILLWTTADSTTYNDGDAVGIWSDISGNNLNLTQSTGSNQPVFVANQINGHPVIRFNNNDNTRIGVGPVDNMFTDQTTIFVVMNTTDANSGIISYNTSSQDNEFLLFNPQNLRIFANGSSITSNVDYTGNPVILTTKWATGNSGQATVYINGRYGYADNLSSSAISTGGYLAIGGEQDSYNGDYDDRQAFDGDIAEVILYKTKLNNAQRTIIENYLSIKYAITIDNDYYTSNDASFIYGFSGVGQESDGYRQKSSSAGFYVEANLSTLDDGEYIMFAHDNSPNTSADINTSTDLPSGVEAAWNRNWYIEKTGNTDATIYFDFGEAMPDGKYPAGTANYVLLYRSSTTGTYTILKSGADGISNSDRVFFNLNDADLQNGYYTLGTLDETESPVEGVDGRSWYTLASGDWDDWEIWTLDPSGALPNNPDHLTPSTSTTSNADKVYILSGKSVTVTSNDKQNALLEVDGTIDFGTTTGHNFGYINGSGRIKLAADNFPSGDAYDFITEGNGEGTVVYYGGSYNLNTSKEFYNVEIDLDAPTNTLTLLKDYTINGKLWIKRGILKINDDASTTNLNISVKKDLYIESNGAIETGSADARHELNLYGDFINYGTAKFTNRTSADYNNEATDGIVDVNFLNATKDQSIKCFNTTNFYRIEIKKGTDNTYILNIDATDPSYFNLLGYAAEAHSATAQLSENNNALGLITGTVRIGSNINIPMLNTKSNYNISEGACLWINGGEVHKDNGTALVPYGKLKVSAGLLTADVTSGITMRQTGSIDISGGTITTRQIRTSVLGAANVGSYVQSGGTVNITSAGSYTDYYSFCLTYPGNVFNMSGGTLHIYDSNGNDESTGAIFINSAPENINVTGGTVICEIKNSSNPFKITSTAPFYNLILRNTRDNTTHHIIDYGNNVSSTDEHLDAQPLIVLNDLTIEDNVLLDNKGQDITVGGDLYISENSQLDNIGTGNNRGIVYNKSAKYTLTFNGENDQEFYIGHNSSDADSWEWYVSNMVIDKPADKRVKLLSSASKDYTNFPDGSYKIRILHIDDTTLVHSGILDQNQYSVRTFDYVQVDKKGQLGVYNEGQTLRWAFIITRDGSITINTEKGAVIGNLKMNSIGTVTFTSDVYIKRIGYYYVGSMDLQTYKLTVDYLNHKYTSDPVKLENSSSSEMFYTAGNASDGGIEIFVPGNLADGSTLKLPLGTDANGVARYTPVEITLSNVTDSGYIQIRPSDDILRTTDPNGGDILSYYWRVSFRGFENGKPTVKYRFTYDDSDDDNSAEASFVAGKVLDIYPFSRTYEDEPTPDLNSVDEADNNIYFDGSGNGFTLDSACYTAGYYTRFEGQPDVYYTDADYKDWGSGSIWHKNSKTGPTGEVPQEGSVAIIYRDDTNTRARIWGDHIPYTPAMVIFEINRNVFPDVTTENQPRLQFRYSVSFDIGRVSGPGMISFQVSKHPDITADWGDFAKDSCATLMYGWDGYTDTIDNFPDQIPSLMFENDKIYINQEITVNYDIILNGTPNVIFLKDALIKRDMIVGYWRGGTFHFPDNGNPVTVTVKGDIDFTRYNPQGRTRKITVDDPGSDVTLEHRLIVYGDIIQGDQDYMELNLFNAQNRPAVILELAGDTSATYTRSSSSIPSLYKIEMNKGDNQNLYFRFADDFELNGPTYGNGKSIKLENGTLILDDPNIDVLASTGGGDFKIPSSAALEIRQGKVTIQGSDAGMLLDGKLKISGGTLDMTQTVGNANNYIHYSASGNATIEVTAGKLLIGSQIRRGLTSDEGILHFIQNGGIVEIGQNSAPESKRAIFEIVNPGSEFSYTGGTFTIVNDHRSNPAIASFYFDPETVNIASGQTITIGNSSTVSGANNFTVYASKPLYNLTIDNSSNTSVTAGLNIVPLTLNGNLFIDNGATLDANALEINIKGNWTNNGTYLPNENTVYFSGTSTQTITGNTEFYKLIKNGFNTVNIDNSTIITVDKLLSIEDGLLNTQEGSIIVKGDLYCDRTVLSGTTTDGIVMQGNQLQFITGNGTFDRLKIDNKQGVEIPTGYTITINDRLLLSKGVFDIGKNLLVITKNADIIAVNPFSATNMIQTNISFTDAGVKKYFPEITSTTTFTYPVGSNGKYTPVIFEINTFSPDNTSIRVKSADERHPSIIEDSESPDPEIADSANVLQYYWIMDAQNVSNFTAEVTMQANPDDIEVTAPYTAADYITARLLDRNNGLWDKYLPDDFNESTSELYFHFNGTDDEGIDGDYTAGVDGTTFNGAIPDQVPLYVSNQDGDWTDKDIWTPTAPAGGPKGARVLVKHHVTIPQNYIVSYQTRIDATGTLDVGTTFGHRLGKVGGTGILYIERGELPAGDYEDFFAADSGTIEFGGNSDYDILSEIPELNNLILSGSGTRNFPNIDVQMLGYFEINGADAVDLYDQKISIKKDLIFNSGNFDAGQGLIALNGNDRQTIKGSSSFTGSNAFYDFEINNIYGIELQQPADIDNYLNFLAGTITTTSDNLLRLTNTNSNIVSGAGNGKYVDGPLAKNIINGQSFDFPVGNDGRYGRVILDVDNSATTDYWTAQYYNKDASLDGMDVTQLASPLEYVSNNEYWRVKAPASYDSYVTLRWDSQSGVPATSTDRENYLKMAEWIPSNNQWEEVTAYIDTDNGEDDGLIKSQNTESFNNDASEGNFYTLASNYYAQFYWEGDESSDWNTAGNWSGNQVPNSYNDVIINSGTTYSPVISNNAEVKNLSIESGATLTIEPGYSLTINNNLTNEGTLILHAPNGDGAYPSLLTYGDITNNGSIQIQLYLTAKEFHYVSSPINGGNATSDLFCKDRPDGKFNSNFYTYDETTDLNGDPNTQPAGDYDSQNLTAGWVYAHNGESGAAVPLQIKKGYAIWDEINRLITFEGTPNNGTLDITGLSYTENDPVPEESVEPNFYDGWHLIGNPYPSYLDWDKIAGSLTNTDNAIYVWDGTQYASYVNGICGGSGNQDNYIAPMQGFFIHTNGTNAGFQLNNTHRTHSSSSFLKNSRTKQDNDKYIVKLKFTAGQYNDYYAVYFADSATSGFDRKYDALKLFSSSYYTQVPHLYSYDGDIRYSIEALNTDSIANQSISLAYKIAQSGEYKISAEQISIPSGVKVYLIDKKYGVNKELAQGSEYTFIADAGDIKDRFELKFLKPEPPVVNGNIKDITVYEDKATTIEIPENLIYSPSKLPMNYEIINKKGEKENWIEYDSEFSNIVINAGNSQVGTHNMVYKATDKNGLSASIPFSVTVINTNDKPVVIKELNDTTAYIDNEFVYDISDAFADIDKNDELKYSAKLTNGNDLPVWLGFDKNTGIFSGEPTNEGELEIMVTATDKAGESAGTTFKLNIVPQEHNNSNIYKVSIYPNPASDFVTIETDLELPYTMKIISTEGKIINTQKVTSKKEKFDISKLAKGNYIIEITSKGRTVHSKLIVK